MKYIFCLFKFQGHNRSGISVVDNALDYQLEVGSMILCLPGLSDETLNQGPVSIEPMCWWDIIPEFTHSLSFLAQEIRLYQIKLRVVTNKHLP